MKKYFIYLFIFASSIVFYNNSNAQTKNQKAKMIIGPCHKEALKTNVQFSEAYHLNYDAYIPDSTKFTELKNDLNGLKIHIVFGTWCGDSKLQVPRFLKLMDTIGFPEENITYEGVDYEKQTSKPLHIEKVPTFIFYKEGKEIYRLIERPETSLENDICTHIM